MRISGRSTRRALMGTWIEMAWRIEGTLREYGRALMGTWIEIRPCRN